MDATFQILSAELACYLEDNKALPDNEAEKARGFRVLLLQALENLDVDIYAVQSTPDIDVERAVIQKTVSQIDTILAPARYVAEDIWREIFYNCRSKPPVLNYSSVPLLLTRVCSGWKRIAESTPQLWRDIRVYPPSWLPMHFEEVAPEWKLQLDWREKTLDEWLNWSGAQPLSIAVTSPSNHVTHNVPGFLDFVNRVMSLSHRLCSLELSLLRSPKSYCGFMELPDSSLANLEELIIDEVLVNFVCGSKTIPWINSEIFHIPRLRKIAIGRLPETEAHNWTIPTNWQNLQYLFIGTPIPVPRILLFFVTLPRLIECHIKIASSTGIISHSTPISLPNLKHLSLSDEINPGETSIPLYVNLDVPALMTLEFSAKLTDRRDHSTTRNPLTLLPQLDSLSKLVLKLESERLFHIWTLETLRKAPSITHLVFNLPAPGSYNQEIYREGDQSRGLLSLTYPGPMLLNEGLKPIVMLPKLEILEVHGMVTVSEEHFRDTILKRLDPTRRDIATLKHVSATFLRCKTIDIESEILSHTQEAEIDFILDLAYGDRSNKKTHYPFLSDSFTFWNI